MIATADDLSLPPALDVGALSRQLATLTLRGFTSAIRAADTQTQRNAASTLINKRYAWRGYGSGFAVDERPGQMTLVATDYPRGTPIGTLTVTLDDEGGLLADHLYHSEVEQLRTSGGRPCEMVKFAVDGMSNKHSLAALFHVAFIYAYHLNDCTDLLVEVTPQHALFYRHMLQFEPFGEERLNPRVHTRGVLLRLNLDYAAEQIRRFGGQGVASSTRSLYPYAFSSVDEHAIRRRMLANGTISAAA